MKHRRVSFPWKCHKNYIQKYMVHDKPPSRFSVSIWMTLEVFLALNWAYSHYLEKFDGNSNFQEKLIEKFPTNSRKSKKRNFPSNSHHQVFIFLIFFFSLSLFRWVFLINNSWPNINFQLNNELLRMAFGKSERNENFLEHCCKVGEIKFLVWSCWCLRFGKLIRRKLLGLPAHLFLEKKFLF